MIIETGHISLQSENQNLTWFERMGSWVHRYPTTAKILKITTFLLGIGLLVSIPLAMPLGIAIVIGLAIVGITTFVASFILFGFSPLALPNTTASDLWLHLQQKTQARLQGLEFLPTTKLPHRFSDIRCPRKTAVSIKGHYLHANKVGEGIAHRSFVATQAPLTEDHETFWKAVFESTPTLFDLTTLKDQTEGGVTKYYPDSCNTTLTYGSMSVRLIEVEAHTYTYQIENRETGAVKRIKRCHYTEWNDFGVISLSALHALVQEVETLSPDPKDLLWIHCRAGVGRTGSLITALILKEKIERGEINQANLDASLVDLIVELRKQRGPAFVQQKDQLDLLRQYANFLLVS